MKYHETDQVAEAAYDWDDEEYDDVMGIPAWGETVYHTKYTMPCGFSDGDWWCRCGWHNLARQQLCYQRDDQGIPKRPKYHSQRGSAGNRFTQRHMQRKY